MSTTKMMISGWFDEGVTLKKDFMLVVCDTFDHEDYPVYATREQVRQCYNEHNENMQRVMEVYDLSFDKEKQLNEQRAFHLPPA